MNWKITGFLIGMLFIHTTMEAQRRQWDGEYTRLGLQGGLNYFNINTDDLDVTAKPSWTAGFTTRSSFYNDFQFIYGINFYDFQIDVAGREKIETATAAEIIEYNMIGVQGNFFGSYKILDHHLSVEAGPVVQVNGKLEARQDKEFYYVDNYDIVATDLEEVSAFNVNFAVGLSGGFERLKFWVQYQHGLNNILNGLNDQDLEEKDADIPEFKGNMSLIAGGITVFL